MLFKFGPVAQLGERLVRKATRAGFTNFNLWTNLPILNEEFNFRF
jgi:hypothetical protein